MGLDGDESRIWIHKTLQIEWREIFRAENSRGLHVWFSWQKIMKVATRSLSDSTWAALTLHASRQYNSGIDDS
jgi:hypothetical protein